MGGLFWVFDSIIDATLLNEGAVLTQLVSPSPAELWIRSFVFFLFIIFSLLMSHEFNKRRKLYEAIQKNEEALRKSAHENELLLREVHHRVKNNMQVMSSICSLQSKQIEDENALNVLKKSSSRIHAMAYVHEHLYQKKNLSEIPTDDYLNSLAEYILHIFETGPDKVDYNSSVENLPSSPDTLLTLGLILNELVSNSLKHAFKDIPAPEISLKLFKDSKGSHHFIYQDNGIGVQEELSFDRTTGSLGLFLTKSFVERLDGTIQIDGSNGTTVHITFDPQYAAASQT